MSILLLKDFLPVAKNILDPMINQCGSTNMTLKQIIKALNRHAETFQKYRIIARDIVMKIAT